MDKIDILMKWLKKSKGLALICTDEGLASAGKLSEEIWWKEGPASSVKLWEEPRVYLFMPPDENDQKVAEQLRKLGILRR